MNMIQKSILCLKLIAFLVFIYLLSTLNFKLFLQSFLTMNKKDIVLYIILYFLAYLFFIMRLRRLLKTQNHPVKLWTAYKIIIEPSFLGTVTPGRIGELSKIIYLSRLGLSKIESINLVIIEKIFDVAILLFFAVVGIAYYLWLYSHSILWLCYYLITLLGAILIGLSFRRLLLKSLIGHYSKTSLFSLLLSHFHCFKSTIKKLGPTSCFFAILISLTHFALMFFLTQAFHLSISFIAISLACAIASIIALAPISFGGLGARELVYVITLGIIGISRASILAFSLFNSIFWGYLSICLLMAPIWLLSLTRMQMK